MAVSGSRAVPVGVVSPIPSPGPQTSSNSSNNGSSLVPGKTGVGIGNIISKIHGALSDAIAPPRFVIDKRTIEKTWKLMDKGMLFWSLCFSGQDDNEMSFCIFNQLSNCANIRRCN